MYWDFLKEFSLTSKTLTPSNEQFDTSDNKKYLTVFMFLTINTL